MKRPPDIITMLPSTGALDLDRAVPAALALFAPQLDALRARRPVLQVAPVANRRAEAQNPTT